MTKPVYPRMSRIEIEKLRAQLAEAEATLKAIRSGQADAIMVEGPNGPRVFTLETTDRSYRVLAEAMNEGVASLARDATILFCNRRLAEMSGYPPEKLVGASAAALFAPAEWVQVRQILEQLPQPDGRCETRLLRPDKTTIPVSLSFTGIVLDEVRAICMVAADLSELQISRQLRALSVRLQQVREEERLGLARNLHDQLAQTLTAVNMELAWLVPRLRDQELQLRLKAAMKTLGQGVRSIRRVCTELRPGILDDLGLAAALEWLGKQFATRTGVRCEVVLAEEEVPAGAEQSLALFRICQEALDNVAQHAEAKNVRVSMKRDGNQLVLLVEDDGRGIRAGDIATVKSLGLLGIKERAQACEGEMQISGERGKGTRLWVSMPIPGRALEGAPAAGAPRRRYA